jgi:multicomponent Na+:H+ antiporter subunit C
METPMALLSGLFFAASFYLLLSRALIPLLLGVALLGNGVNLLILTAGRLGRALPPIAPEGAMAPLAGSANPLPQALILTAIVIGFSLFAVLLVLAARGSAALRTDDTDQMRLAEPRGEARPDDAY